MHHKSGRSLSSRGALSAPVVLPLRGFMLAVHRLQRADARAQIPDCLYAVEHSLLSARRRQSKYIFAPRAARAGYVAHTPHPQTHTS